MSDKDIYEEIKGGKFYLHINNGGVSFEIKKQLYKDKVIPIFEVSAHHFGIQTNQMILPMTPENINKLGIWISDMSQKFNDDNIYK